MDTNQAMPTNSNGIRKETVKSPITVTRIYTNEFQKKGTETAELKQTLSTKSFYPSAKVESSLNGGLFGTEEFGFSEQEFDAVETRMAWILVPEGTTIEQVSAKLAIASAAGAVIYKALSNQPILDENQVYAIANGDRTVEQFAEKQVVRYPADSKDKVTGEDISNKLILDKAGHVMYKRTFFWATKREDVDSRGKGTPYLSPALKVELSGASVMRNQEL